MIVSLTEMRKDINLSLTLHEKIYDSIASNTDLRSDTTVSGSKTTSKKEGHSPKSYSGLMQDLLEQKKKDLGMNEK